MSFRLSLAFVVSALAIIGQSLVAQEVKGVIRSVYDGDTFILESSGSTTKIRLNGIDCPEMGQPFGESAREFWDHYLGDSISVVIVDYDKYGRSVADVFYHDTLLNFQLIEEGLAWHFKKYSTDSLLAEAEINAALDSVGLWSDPNAIAPWDWRSGNYDQSKVKSNNGEMVFICIKSTDGLYHSAQYCNLFRKCESSIIQVFPDEATQVYNRVKCNKCFN